MKIFHIVMIIARYPPMIGGTERQCRELSKALHARGHRVSVLTERYAPGLPAFEIQDGIEIYRFPCGGLAVSSAIRFGGALWRWLSQHPDVDVLHAHMLAGPAMAAYVIGKLRGKPVLIKIAGAGVTGDIGTSQKLWRGRLKLRLFKRWARWVVCPSVRTLKEIESLGVSSNSLRLIPNGVSMDRFRPRGVAEKPERHDLVALYVGRWANGKGVESLLSVWELAQRRTDFSWTLQLVVSQPLTSEQHNRLRSLGNAVQVSVNVADPAPFYQASDLAVLMSENEGLSNFLLEAMASGLPLLTSPSAAIAPAEESTPWSWTASPERPDDVLALLKMLQKNTVLLKIKGEAARRKAEENFSTNTVAKAYEQLYMDILKT